MYLIFLYLPTQSTGGSTIERLAWILGAIAEELFFRWFLLTRIFLRRLKSIPAIILASVLFTGIHLLNLRAGAGISTTLLQMLFAFCFSVWAGAAVYRTGSVLIPLLAHVLLNVTAGDGEIAWATLLLSAALLADGGILLWKGAREP